MIQSVTKNRITPRTTGNGNGGRGGTGKPPKRPHRNGSSSSGNGSGHGAPCAADVELAVQRWEAKRAEAKAAYACADDLEAALIAALGVGGSQSLSDGRVVRINDNFRDKNGNPKAKAWTVAGVKLAEVEVK